MQPGNKRRLPATAVVTTRAPDCLGLNRGPTVPAHAPNAFTGNQSGMLHGRNAVGRLVNVLDYCNGW